MSRGEVLKLLGPPTSMSESKLIYMRDDRSNAPIPRESPGPPRDYAELVIELTDGEARAIHTTRSDMI